MTEIMRCERKNRNYCSMTIPGMVNATNLCFAILAVKMCMKTRFDKRPERPVDMGLKSIWFDGAEDIKVQTNLPDKFDKSKETDVIIHGYLVDTSLPEIRDLAGMLKQVRMYHIDATCFNESTLKSD